MGFHKSFLCRYAAIKVVSIHDKKLAITFWGSLLFTFCFTLFCTVYFKEYQATDDALAMASIKIKGTASRIDDLSYLYDATDLVHVIDSETVFITTAFVEHARLAGKQFDAVTGRDNMQKVQISDLNKWTVYWRQELFFPSFGFRTRTEPTQSDGILTMKNILQDIDIAAIADKGAVIKVSCDWKCNLDVGRCDKSYRVRRLDHGDGYNYWVKTNDKTVEKRYGIKLIFQTDGIAGKFSWYKSFIAFCSVLAFVGFIRLVTDMVLMYCVSERLKYYNGKYDHLYKNDETGKWVIGNSLAADDHEPPMIMI